MDDEEMKEEIDGDKMRIFCEWSAKWMNILQNEYK